jgi:YidC/Oxa1 family membrane protein insertase
MSGILAPIENVLTAVLEWLHTAIGLPWAWAIIALTLMVRMVILPLTIKQIRSMQRLQAHAPELKAIQQKYKNDKQKMNEEVMRFYRENNVNPLASCLPLVLQIPIFISLYFVLRDFRTEIFPAYEAEGETIGDLGWLGIVPNIDASITSHWSGWLLLAIATASTFASIYFMPTGANPSQRWIMMVLLPVSLPAFVLFFAPTGGFPTGLMLYWSTTNLWTVGQGLITRRFVPKTQPAPKRTSRTPPKTAPAAGDGAPAADSPSGDAAAKPSGAGQQRVRRRKKKKGSRARR